MGIREFPGSAPRGKGIAIGMRRSPDVSPRRLSDISPQLRQLKYLVVDEAIKEDLKWSRSVEDLTSGPVGLTSIEERILRITGYYGYQPWATSYKREERPRDSPGPAEAQAPAGTEAGGRSSRHCWRCSRAQLKKIFWGVAVVLCVCASWAGATQLAKLTFRKFDAPFTLTWFATNWNFLFFPLYYTGHICKSAEKQSVKQRYRWCSSKESAANAGDLGDMDSIPGSGKFPGRGNGDPLQCSCLENPIDRGTWRATVHRVTKSRT